MLALLKGWAFNIVAVVILAVLVDIILPSNSFKKYTGFVFGLILIIVMLQPVLQILGRSEVLIRSVISNAAAMENEAVKNQAEIFGGMQDDQIMEIYKKNMESSIAVAINSAFDLTDTSVSITFRQRNDGFDPSGIDRLDIETSLRSASKGVKPVIINIGGSVQNRDALSEEHMKESIRNLMSEIYGIETDRIFIKFN